jgi:hypothetical protein
VVQQVQIEEKEIDGKSGIEKECSRKKYPEPTAQFLLSNPSGGISPESGRLLGA